MHLELGGKAPFLVFDDADLDAAVQGAVAGALINTGQDCTAATRAYVQRPLYDAFVDGVAEVMGQVRLGPTLDPSTDQGPLVSRRQQERVAGFVERARGRRRQGRARRPRSPRRATSLAAPTTSPPCWSTRPSDSEIVQDEIFGPVLVVLPFDDDDEGLRAGQRHPVRPGRVGVDPRRLPVDAGDPGDPAGCVWVNDHIPIISEMPHGGYKQSGFGKDMSTYSFDEYTQVKHVMYDLTASGQQGLAPHRLRHPLKTRSRRNPRHDREADPFIPSPALMRGLLTRRTVMQGAAAAGAAAALAACGVKGTSTSSSASAKPTTKDMSDVDKLVNWSNWPEYIDVDDTTKTHPTLDEFTKKTGIKVNYTEDVNDNDEFFAKIRPQLSAGQDTGRDTFCLTDWMASRLIRLGWVQKLDKANIPNWTNLERQPPAGRVRQGPRVLAALAERVHRHRLQPEVDRRREDRDDRPAAHRPGHQGQGHAAHRDARHRRPDHAVPGQGPGELHRRRLQRRHRRDPEGQGRRSAQGLHRQRVRQGPGLRRHRGLLRLDR